MLGLVGDHLWQSTLCVGVAAVLAMNLRKAPAGVRFWIWFAASAKFLVPFATLVVLGAATPWTSVPQSRTNAFDVVETVSQPFSKIGVVGHAPNPPRFDVRAALVAALPAMWLVGTVVVLVSWTVRWRRVRALVRSAVPLASGREHDILRGLEARLGEAASLPIRASAAELEPGIVGLIRPVLLWPNGLSLRLTDAQIEGILAHELAHVRRRDNLTAALHMAVEGLFWFHPLVWWLGARLVDERERTCDEHAVRVCRDPAVYAEGILRTCERHRASPLTCVSGVTGSDLKGRIEGIMLNNSGQPLSRSARWLLVIVATLTFVTPTVFGALGGGHVRAQASIAQAPTDAAAQAATPANDATSVFEVASIRVNKTGEWRVSGGFQSGGRYRVTNYPLRNLIAEAYLRPQINPDFLISGGPNWIDSDRFDIDAKATGEFPPGPDGPMAPRRVMLQKLLADRFGLRVHIEQSDRPIYAATMARTDRRPGPQLRSTTTNCAALFAGAAGNPPDPQQVRACSPRIGPGFVAATGSPLAFVLNLLPRFVNRVVVDRTGLAGVFDIELKWTPAPGEWTAPPSPDTSPSASADGASLFSALQEQLGIKLESTRGPVEVLVIDRAERPTEN
jgi:bla regulator protein blaR1